MDNTYQCQVCGQVYDPRNGDNKQGIPPETPFERLPNHWICPICGSSKDLYQES